MTISLLTHGDLYKNKLIISLLILLFSQNVFSQTTRFSSKDSSEVHYKFIVAASQGETKKVNEYLKLGVFINFRDAQGGTALFYAVNNSYPEIVKTLLYYGANPNIGTSDGYTPLMAAASNGDFDIAQLLLYIKRTNINLVDKHRTSALMYAAYYGNYYIVDMLLFYHANIKILDMDYNSALYYAALNGDTAIASRLIKAGDNILHNNKQDNSPLKVAIQNNDSLLFDVFINKLNFDKIDNKTKKDILLFAIDTKNNYAVKHLLKDNYTLNSNLSSDKEFATHAYITENRELIKTIKEYKFANSYTPVFTSFLSKFSSSFNGMDYMCYMDVGIRESHYNIDFNLRYGTRFKQYSIIKKQSDNVYYQLWEKRRIISMQIRKNFLLFSSENKIAVKPFIAVDFQEHWGKYNGYSLKINPNFHIIPEAGISFQNNWLMVDISYQYANFGLENIAYSRINIGLGFILPLYQESTKNNDLWFL